MKKMSFVFLLIFSLLIINGKEYKCDTKYDLFNEVEGYMLNRYEFIDNGVKLEYTLEKDINAELKRINDIFLCKNDFIVSNIKNSITAKSKDINYSVNIYSYDEIIKVEVVVINKNKNISIDDLRKIALEIRNDEFIEERYFSFIKSKLNKHEEGALKEIEENLKVEISESLSINNGSIAKATLRNEMNINIGQINYDTGSYLIIGTPIIFVTY